MPPPAPLSEAQAPAPGSLLLHARGLIVDYPGARALNNVDFEVAPGEVHAVLGENGAGKSTLINILSGLIRPDAGNVTLSGSEFQPTSPHDAASAGISTVHQELDLIPSLSIAENTCLGRFPARRGFISWRQTRRRAAAALARLGITLDPRRTLGDCSLAQQQLVAIARALDTDCRILILDEPTSSLDAAEVRHLFDLLARLRAQGLGIILITHFLDQAYAIADRITVLRNGSRLGTWPAADLPRTALIEAMTGRSLDPSDRATGFRGSSADARATAPSLLTIRNLARRHSIHTTSLTLSRGETLGLAGLLGSGRTELANLIFGADAPDQGHITFDGRRLHASIPESIRHGMAMTPEDRKTQGLFLDLSIRDNIVLALQARSGPLRPIPLREQRRLADHYTRTLNIKAPSPDTPVRTLSGGNQQKVLLARWLAIQPKLLILDEPTRGIDVGARAEIESLIHSLRAEGLAIILISAEIDEIARVCDRAVILRDRRCIAELESDQLTESNILSQIAAPAAS